MMRELGLIEHLSRHGIDAGCLDIGDDSGGVGEALLDMADKEHATMIVMGPCSDCRIRETVLDGVTRHILKHAEIPVPTIH